jgi:hypothetical protein
MANFDDILNKISGKPRGTAAISTEDLKAELLKREQNPLIFPLHVFPPELKPMITELCDTIELEPSYVGSLILAIAGGAMGNAYKGGLHPSRLTTTQGWYILVGESSSGKSLAIDMLTNQIRKIEDQYMKDFELEELRNETLSKDEKKEKWQMVRKGIWKQSGSFPAFIRKGIVPNPKGLFRIHDELVEWLTNMYQYSKGESPEAQFWLSTWTNKAYQNEILGNEVYIPAGRTGTALFGGTQPKLLFNFFEKGRYESGMTNRFLFAIPETKGKMLVPDPFSSTDTSIFDVWDSVVEKLHKDMPFGEGIAPYTFEFRREAVQLIYDWQLMKREEIEASDDYVLTSEVMGSYIGKINIYVARFAGILAMLEKVCKGYQIQNKTIVERHVAAKAIELCEYYLKSFARVYSIVYEQNSIPMDVIEFAQLISVGKSLTEISKIQRLVKKAKASDQAHTNAGRRKFQQIISKYPNVLNISTKGLKK